MTVMTIRSILSLQVDQMYYHQVMKVIEVLMIHQEDHKAKRKVFWQLVRCFYLLDQLVLQ